MSQRIADDRLDWMLTGSAGRSYTDLEVIHALKAEREHCRKLEAEVAALKAEQPKPRLREYE